MSSKKSLEAISKDLRTSLMDLMEFITLDHDTPERGVVELMRYIERGDRRDTIPLIVALGFIETNKMDTLARIQRGELGVGEYDLHTQISDMPVLDENDMVEDALFHIEDNIIPMVLGRSPRSRDNDRRDRGRDDRRGRSSRSGSRWEEAASRRERDRYDDRYDDRYERRGRSGYRRR